MCLILKKKYPKHMKPQAQARKKASVSLLVVGLLFLPITPFVTQAQIPAGPVTDVGVVVPNGVILTAKTIMKKALEDSEVFIGLIKDVGEFFQKANKVVNESIKNMRMVKAIVEDYQQILDMYNQALTDIADITLSADNLDGVEEIVFDKIKHTKILAALLKETENSFELFTEIMDEDKLIMDDKGRVMLIQKTHFTLRKTKNSMRVAMRRVNREIFYYKRDLQNLSGHDFIFGYN